jgi:hypothetical protein
MRGKNSATSFPVVVLFLYIMGAAAAPSPAAPVGSDGIPEIHAPGAYFQPQPGVQRSSATLQDIVRTSARLTAGERHDLGPLSGPESALLRAREAGNRERVKIGIVRTPGAAVTLSGFPSGLAAGAERSQSGGIARREVDGRLSWTTAFTSQGAGAVRLHVTEAQLPQGSRVYVYSDRGEVHGPYSFDSGLRAEGFWTNSVAGEQIYLEVQLASAPAGSEACRLTVTEVAHLNRNSNPTLSPEASPPDTTCFKDASCVTASDFPLLDSATHAVAALEFEDGGSFFLCSGGLIGAIGNASVPYLLTANHCFDNQPSATSLEAWWNFKTSSCGQPFPDESTFPSTLGSTLLATGTTSDYTLVVLSQNPPAGSFLLGWTTQDVASSSLVTYRLSYPAPNGESEPQQVTRQVIQGTPFGTCSGLAQGNYIYSTQNLGGTTGGSSGSPSFLADGSIVGQLLGKCGTNTSDPCDGVNNYLLDGAFRQTYPAVAGWLNPQGSSPCTPSSTALCLSGGRFRVTAAWESATASGDGTGVQLTPDTGYFWFFESTNVEMIVKVLNGCSINNNYWVFSGGLTNVRVTVYVTDTQNGNVRTYINPVNVAFQPIQDTSAFSTCP